MIRLIDAPLLDAVCAEAAASPRRRKNRNFHPRDDYPGHRLLNAMQPDSYIPPHRHLDPAKDETFVVLRGRLGLVIFDDEGEAVRTVVMSAGAGETPKVSPGGTAPAASPACGADLPHGTWHSLVALTADVVFLEAKSGPYLPLADAEKAPWAPAEQAPGAAAYLEGLRRLFA